MLESETASDTGDIIKRLSPAPHVIAAVHGGLTVLLDPVEERYFSLVGVGGTIWSLLEDSPTIDDVIKTLADRYRVDDSSLVADVHEFVAALLASRLVVIA